MSKLQYTFLIAIIFTFTFTNCDKNEVPENDDKVIIGCTNIIDDCSVTEKELNLDLGLRDAFFLNTNLGFVSGNSGKIYRTKDAGDTWEQLTTETVFHINSVFFIDENIGYASGEKLGESLDEESWGGAIFLSTVDGGETWSKTYRQDLLEITNLHFFNTLIGFARIKLREDNMQVHKLAKTIDGGETWEYVDVPFNSKNQSILLGENKIFIIGDNLNIFSSSDQGETWVEHNIPAQNTNRVTDLYFVNDNLGFSQDIYGNIFKTIDGGENWTTIETTFNMLRGMHFFDTNQGFVVTDIYEYEGGEFPQYKGSMMHQTKDGGDSWMVSDTLTECQPGFLFTFPEKEHGFILSFEHILEIKQD